MAYAWWYLPFLLLCAVVTMLSDYPTIGALMLAGLMYRRVPELAWQGAKNIAFLLRYAVWKIRRWRR